MIHRAIQRAYYIANTQYEADYVIEHGARPDRVFPIGVGVDLDVFGETSPVEARQALGLDDGPVVGFIGQIGGHKGIDTLLKAMPRVWQAHPTAWLLIAGARTSYMTEVERLIAKLAPQERERVRLHPGFAPQDKGKLFAAVDVFAYPSGFESFGIAFLEAWAAGKPVVGCRSGAIPTVIADGSDGLLVTYGDPSSLALAILLLLNDPSMRARFGAAGRRKVEARYTWPHIARRFREVYRLAIESRRLSALGSRL
jgi:glycosyltransferase involved in cell wall biosynthesis